MAEITLFVATVAFVISILAYKRGKEMVYLKHRFKSIAPSVETKRKTEALATALNSLRQKIDAFDHITRKTEQTITSDGTLHGTLPPSQRETLYEPSSEVLFRRELKRSTEQSAVSAVTVEYAGFWKRFAANSIDFILTYILVFIVCLIFGLSIALTGGGIDQVRVTGWIIGSLIQWLYWAVMESSPTQGTLGKMALGIIVTDLHGDRISFGRATGRYWAKFISTLILLIGFIMAGFTSKKQALHDMMADTLVTVKKRS
jgi:uncharacterized RDD family membrane protein YckC